MLQHCLHRQRPQNGLITCMCFNNVSFFTFIRIVVSFLSDVNNDVNVHFWFGNKISPPAHTLCRRPLTFICHMTLKYSALSLSASFRHSETAEETRNDVTLLAEFLTLRISSMRLNNCFGGFFSFWRIPVFLQCPSFIGQFAAERGKGVSQQTGADPPSCHDASGCEYSSACLFPQVSPRQCAEVRAIDQRCDGQIRAGGPLSPLA